MKQSGLHISKQRRLLPTLALLVVAALLVFGGVAVARYVLQQQEAGLATGADFYFTSDYLKDSSENASYIIDPQTTSFTIALSNFADSQRVTTTDITYSVAVDGATVSDAGSGILKGGSQSTTALTITPLPGQDSFAVTATSSASYKKELTATFVLATGSHYTVEDAVGNAAAVLTITCTDGDPVSLVVPSNVIPDATDSRITSVTGGYSFTPSEAGVYSLVLLKENRTISLARENTPFTNEIDLKSSSTTL